MQHSVSPYTIDCDVTIRHPTVPKALKLSRSRAALSNGRGGGGGGRRRHGRRRVEHWRGLMNHRRTLVHDRHRAVGRDRHNRLNRDGGRRDGDDGLRVAASERHGLKM